MHYVEYIPWKHYGCIHCFDTWEDCFEVRNSLCPPIPAALVPSHHFFYYIFSVPYNPLRVAKSSFFSFFSQWGVCWLSSVPRWPWSECRKKIPMWQREAATPLQTVGLDGRSVNVPLTFWISCTRAHTVCMSRTLRTQKIACICLHILLSHWQHKPHVTFSLKVRRNGEQRPGIKRPSG